MCERVEQNSLRDAEMSCSTRNSVPGLWKMELVIESKSEAANASPQANGWEMNIWPSSLSSSSMSRNCTLDSSIRSVMMRGGDETTALACLK